MSRIILADPISVVFCRISRGEKNTIKYRRNERWGRWKGGHPTTLGLRFTNKNINLQALSNAVESDSALACYK